VCHAHAKAESFERELSRRVGMSEIDSKNMLTLKVTLMSRAACDA
jgi:hypothetical protein